MMFNKLLQLYLKGQITINGLDKAVSKGWITEDEKQLIISRGDINETNVSK